MTELIEKGYRIKLEKHELWYAQACYEFEVDTNQFLMVSYFEETGDERITRFRSGDSASIFNSYLESCKQVIIKEVTNLYGEAVTKAGILLLDTPFVVMSFNKYCNIV